MSMTPYALKKNRLGSKNGNDEVVDLMIHDGLWIFLTITIWE